MVLLQDPPSQDVRVWACTLLYTLPKLPSSPLPFALLCILLPSRTRAGVNQVLGDHRQCNPQFPHISPHCSSQRKEQRVASPQQHALNLYLSRFLFPSFTSDLASHLPSPPHLLCRAHFSSSSFLFCVCSFGVNDNVQFGSSRTCNTSLTSFSPPGFSPSSSSVAGVIGDIFLFRDGFLHILNNFPLYLTLLFLLNCFSWECSKPF